MPQLRYGGGWAKAGVQKMLLDLLIGVMVLTMLRVTYVLRNLEDEVRRQYPLDE